MSKWECERCASGSVRDCVGGWLVGWLVVGCLVGLVGGWVSRCVGGCVSGHRYFFFTFRSQVRTNLCMLLHPTCSCSWLDVYLFQFCFGIAIAMSPKPCTIPNCTDCKRLFGVDLQRVQENRAVCVPCTGVARIDGPVLSQLEGKINKKKACGNRKRIVNGL